MSTRRVLEEVDHRLPTLSDGNLKKLKERVEEEDRRAMNGWLGRAQEITQFRELRDADAAAKAEVTI